MPHNSQDQRFQKILSLWASLAFQAAQGTVLRVHPKPVNPHDFQWQPKLPHQAPLSFMSLYMMLAETVPRMFMDQTTKIIYLEGFLSAGSVQSCSWHGTGVPQGREKQARERSISLLGIKPRWNISFHSCYQSISYLPPGYSCSTIPWCSKKILTTSKSFLSCSVIITGLKNIPGCQSKWRNVFNWW